MNVREYRVLQWDGAFDGPWSSSSAARYRSEGFDGLSLMASTGWTPGDLEFLRELPGLRYLEVSAKLSNDLAAFRIDTLEELTLVTGSRRRVPDVVQARLRSVCLTDRPGIAVTDRWPALERLRLGAWRGSDFELLRGSEHLSSVHVEGRRQEGTLDGVDECASLARFTSINYSIEDSAPLRGLRELREVKMMAAPPGRPHGRISFSDFAGKNLEKIWISNSDELVDVGILSSLPRLRDLRLIHCRLTNADIRSLDTLTNVNVDLIEPRVW